MSELEAGNKDVSSVERDDSSNEEVNAHPQHVDWEAEKRLVRKFDWHILPLVFALCAYHACLLRA